MRRGEKTKVKVPKKIIDELERRTKAAYAWNDADYNISKWLDDHEIEVDTCDYHGGVEGIVNPRESAKRIIEAIEKA